MLYLLVCLVRMREREREEEHTVIVIIVENPFDSVLNIFIGDILGNSTFKMMNLSVNLWVIQNVD